MRHALDPKNVGCGIFVDHQKAFDTVDHRIILVKLDQYCVCGMKNSWFKSYLADRKEYFYKWLQIFSCLIAYGISL